MSKKIEPTDAMVQEAEFTRRLWGPDVRAILYTALNHPDAPGLFMDEDDRPWEPLNGPVRVGDGVRQDAHGFTRIAVVGSVDEEGDPWTAEGIPIGDLDAGTWYVRRAVQELPTKPETVIVANDGHEYITATRRGETYRAREAALIPGGLWMGAWRSTSDALHAYANPDQITPGTWKVDDK